MCWCWLLCFVGVSTITEIHSDTPPRLQIRPEGDQVTKPVGSSLALTCKPNVENPRLITQLEWRDPKDRRIDVTNSDAELYIQKLAGELGAILIFSKLTEHLAGKYTCSAFYANSEHLIASTIVNTIIDITWVNAPESQYPILGKKYKIHCEVKANPAPTINWLKNGEDIDLTHTEDSPYIVENNGLTIKKVKESDDGVYTCRAVVFNTGEIQTKNIKVEVQIAPSIYPLNKIEIVEGEEASAVCNGTGKPPPSFTWIKENTREDLSKSDRFTVKKNTGLLIIHRVEFSDNSYYKCFAENPAGKAEMRVKVDVLVKPKIYELLNVTAPVDGGTKIICKANGRPAPKISFRKLSKLEPFQNGAQFEDPRIIQEYFPNEEKGESIGTLTFNRLLRSDDGLYVCIAENKVETAYKNGHVTVEFPPTFEKTEDYPPVWSWNNNPGNLTCIAESIPNATIQWRLNGYYIENDKSPNLQQVGNGPISHLIVKPYNEPRFYTFYECIARNKLGEAMKRIELRQATVPGHIQQVKPESITATTIKFGIVGPPNYHGLPLRSITVQFRTDKELSWDTATLHTWSYNASYTLENLLPEETYNFQFAARNDVGLGPWGGNQQIRMPRRSVPAEPKIILEGHIPDLDNYVTADIVTNSNYADHFRLHWTVPNDNGDPIDSYIIKYCLTQKVNGVWRDSASECSEEITQSFQYTTYDMHSLRPDTTYKVELRAHNAIGRSSPAEIRVKTARGLNSVVYQDGEFSISSSMIIGIVVGAVVLGVILVDLICCCINRAGIIALICDQLRSKPVDEEDPKLGSDEKEPLKPELKDQPILVNGDRCNMSVEFDGRQVYTKPGEIIGKHSVV